MDCDFLPNSIKYYMQNKEVAEQNYNEAIKQKEIIIAIFYKSKKANKEKTSQNKKQLRRIWRTCSITMQIISLVINREEVRLRETGKEMSLQHLLNSQSIWKETEA